jgi:MtN3 and saliva related transmembrane protein
MEFELQSAARIAGSLGGLLGVAAFFPQAYRILQRRSARDVSLLMYISIIAGCALWMFYSYVFGLVELFITNAAITVVALFIAGLRLRYGRENPRIIS